MEKKNTGLIVLVVILLIAVLGLGGFIVYDKTLKNSNDSKDNSSSNLNQNISNSNLEKIDESKDIVYTKDQFEISNYSNDITLSEIPQINLKSDMVEEINNEILSVIKENMNVETFAEKYKYEDPNNENINNYQTIYHVDYEYYVKDNILSLVVKYLQLAPVNLEYQYMIYNIDIENNIRLLNSDLVKELGYTIPQTNNEIINQIGIFYENMAKEANVKWDSKDIHSNESSNALIYNTKITDLYTDSRSYFLEFEKDTQILIPLYIDSEGKINAILKLSVPGGSGDSVRNITLFD